MKTTTENSLQIFQTSLTAKEILNLFFEETKIINRKQYFLAKNVLEKLLEKRKKEFSVVKDEEKLLRESLQTGISDENKEKLSDLNKKSCELDGKIYSIKLALRKKETLINVSKKHFSFSFNKIYEETENLKEKYKKELELINTRHKKLLLKKFGAICIVNKLMPKSENEIISYCSLLYDKVVNKYNILSVEYVLEESLLLSLGNNWLVFLLEKIESIDNSIKATLSEISEKKSISI